MKEKIYNNKTFNTDFKKGFKWNIECGMCLCGLDGLLKSFN